MNQTAVKSIIFFADFTADGFLTERSRREYDNCLETASNWKATLKIVHAKRVSDIASPSSLDYDNSLSQRAKRRAEYVLSGLILRAEERGLTAEAGVVYGSAGLEILHDSCRRDDSVIWSDFAAPVATV